MLKAVLKLDLFDDKEKKKAMKIASGFAGVESIAMDMKDKKLTVAGGMNPAELVEKLRKQFPTEIVSVGPAKETQKKDNKKKDDADKKKDDSKSKYYGRISAPPPPPPPPYYFGTFFSYSAPPPPPVYNYGRYDVIAGEDPGCVIC